MQIADRGRTLACVVTAANVAGPGQPATSKGLPVAHAGTLGCPHPSGLIHAQSIGPLMLGMTQHDARSKLPLRAAKGSGIDDFCLFAGWDVAAGYPSRELLTTVSDRIAKKLTKRVVILRTSNPFYAQGGVQPGVTLRAVRNSLHPLTPQRIGSTHWYFVSRAIAAQIFEVRDGSSSRSGWPTIA